MDPWRYQALDLHKIGDQEGSSFYYALRLPAGIGPNFVLTFDYLNQENEPDEITIMVTGISRFLEIKTFFQDNGYRLIDIYFLSTKSGLDLVLSKPKEIRLMNLPLPSVPGSDKPFDIVGDIARATETFQVLFEDGTSKVYGAAGLQEKYITIWKKSEDKLKKPLAME
jgi:hypothetical protein